ncbi:MAG: hypothetical protein ABJH05_11715 [Fulvivirga sp.]
MKVEDLKNLEIGETVHIQFERSLGSGSVKTINKEKGTVIVTDLQGHNITLAASQIFKISKIQ